MSKRRRIEITIFRRTVVRYARSSAIPPAQPNDDKDASHQDCDDSFQAEELDRALDQRQRPLPRRKEIPN